MKPRSRPAKRQQKKHLPANYWKNPENQKRMLIAMAERFALKPYERPKQIAKEAGYADYSTIHYGLGRFRLSELGKAQKAGTRGGFRRKRPAHERRALYKRILQSIIRESFKGQKALAAELGIPYRFLGQTIYNMQTLGSMPPRFLQTQRLKLIYKADTGGLTLKELASKVHSSEFTVWRHRQQIKKIKEFAQKHNKSVDWVINRYGTLVKAGLLK